MILVPIFDRFVNRLDEATIKQIWMLLERNGTYCTSVDTVEDALTYATENDIPLTGEPLVSDSFIFLPVDHTSPSLDLFYTWNETLGDEQPMRTVWRPFMWISNEGGNDVWGTNTYLKDTSIADGFSVVDVVEAWMKVSVTT
jgi:hypothetical protein